jgi:hypothetical protein
MAINPETLPVQRASELEIRPQDKTWLIQQLWGQAAVGILGGPPKCCKSWLGLDMAVSVASATPCLGHFAVQAQGPTLVYLAEDALSMVRARLEALCGHRRLDIRGLDLQVITASSLRLDQRQDRQRLKATLEKLKPRMLLLDPLVRLHHLDENSAGDISKLLGFLRELQRTFDTAIVLVHHASKKHRAQPGQALRGSSDLHAFGDSNAYLARQSDRLVLTLEHRAAKAPDPITLELVSTPEGEHTHLEVRSEISPDPAATLTERALLVLQNASKPLSRKCLRDTLKVNNQRLGNALEALERRRVVVRTARGWVPLRTGPALPHQAGVDDTPDAAQPTTAQGPQAGQCPLPL